MQISKQQLDDARAWIPNLRVVSDTLIRGGQPEAKGLKMLKDMGIVAVINLCGGSSLSAMFRSAGGSCVETREAAEERQAALKLGLEFVSIPLDVFGDPPLEAVRQFLEVVSDGTKQPAFVHCLHGRDRTGLMSAIYRVKVDGWTVERAYEEMLDCGFDGGRTNLSDVLFSFAKQDAKA